MSKAKYKNRKYIQWRTMDERPLGLPTHETLSDFLSLLPPGIAKLDLVMSLFEILNILSLESYITITRPGNASCTFFISVIKF